MGSCFDHRNGKEFANFKGLDRALEMNACLAWSHHSWERGRNDNTNGLLRQFSENDRS